MDVLKVQTRAVLKKYKTFLSLKYIIRVFQSSLIIQPSVDDMGEGADDSLGVHDEGGE